MPLVIYSSGSPRYLSATNNQTQAQLYCPGIVTIVHSLWRSRWFFERHIWCQSPIYFNCASASVSDIFLSGVRTWICSHIHQFLCYVITHQWRIIDRELALEPQATVTHLFLNKIAAISKTIFSNRVWMKRFLFRFEFHWSVFLRLQLIINQHWFR